MHSVCKVRNSSEVQLMEPTLFFFLSFGVCTRLVEAEKQAGRSLRVTDEVQPLRIDIGQVWSFCEVWNNPAGLWVIDLDWGDAAAAFVQRCCDQQSCEERWRRSLQFNPVWG